MSRTVIHRTLTFLIAGVWIVFGLFCKVLHLVPRHQLIVARILGDRYSGVLTRTIGVLEVLMALWILSSVKSRYCAMAQIVVVAAMNVLELTLAPDLLLFGRLNLLIASLFITVVYYNEFVLMPHQHLAQSHIRP